jgi:hypothetical protein
MTPPDLGNPDQAVLLAHAAARAERDRKYPEHAKLRLVVDESQRIGRFLDWLESEREPPVSLCTGEPHLGNGGMHYERIRPGIEDLLAEYFGIDRQKLSEEKDAMVEELHT